MAVGKTVKALRGTKTQRQVAEAAGIPISTLSKIEQARQIPRNDTFEKLAIGLGLSTTELEQEIVRTTLGDLEEERRKEAGGAKPRRSRARARREEQDEDLVGIPRAAALRLKSTLSTVETLRNHLDNLEHDIRSLSREFQLLKSLHH